MAHSLIYNKQVVLRNYQKLSKIVDIVKLCYFLVIISLGISNKINNLNLKLKTFFGISVSVLLPLIIIKLIIFH